MLCLILKKGTESLFNSMPSNRFGACFRVIVLSSIIHMQGITVFKTGVVQRKRKKTLETLGHAAMYPRVHALVFDPKVNGTLQSLPSDGTVLLRFESEYCS